MKKWCECILEEVGGACHYAKKYIHYKSDKMRWATAFHDMAEQELSHASNLMEMAREYMASLSWVSEEDKECFEHCEGKFAEKTAIVKLMLAA